MNIRINNRPVVLPDNLPLFKVIGERELSRISAAWVNGEPVLREDYKKIIIKDGDRIKVHRITGEYDLFYLRYGNKHFGMRHKENC